MALGSGDHQLESPRGRVNSEHVEDLMRRAAYMCVPTWQPLRRHERCRAPFNLILCVLTRQAVLIVQSQRCANLSTKRMRSPDRFSLPCLFFGPSVSYDPRRSSSLMTEHLP
jgi:hypothetical protein